MQTYAIGDIHGHLDQLRALHDLIEADRAQWHPVDPVVHVGDLVDRGPASAGVVDYLRRGIAGGEPWVVLRGNHDRLFAKFLDDVTWQDPGLRAEYGYLHPRIGGAETLASYGLHAPGDRPLPPVHAEAVAAVPAAHRRFLKSLPTSFLRGEALFVHAGIRPGVDLMDQAEDDLLWIRSAFLEDTREHGALVVHGHTAIDRPTHYGNRLNLDSGAAYGGPLSAVVIDGRDAWHLTPAGRVALAPEGPAVTPPRFSRFR